MARVRNHHFDNIKALLILLVVMGHVISKFGGGTAINDTYKLIFSFHMPAFLFVSGYFARFNPKKVFATLFPLYIVFQMAEYFETGIISYVNSGVWKPAEDFQFFKPAWMLWYLVAMMVFQLLIPIFDTQDKKKRVGFMILAFALGMAIGLNQNINNFLAMSRVFVFLPYFMFGYYEKDGNLLLDLKKKHTAACKTIAWIGMAIIIGIFIQFGPLMGARNFFGTDSYTDVNSFIARILCWIVAFAWIFILVMLIPEKEIPVIGRVGSNTLPVYLLHAILLLILVQTPLYGIVHGNLLLMWILSVAITLVLSLNVFEKALRRISIPIKK